MGEKGTGLSFPRMIFAPSLESGCTGRLAFVPDESLHVCSGGVTPAPADKDEHEHEHLLTYSSTHSHIHSPRKVGVLVATFETQIHPGLVSFLKTCFSTDMVSLHCLNFTFARR